MVGTNARATWQVQRGKRRATAEPDQSVNHDPRMTTNQSRVPGVVRMAISNATEAKVKYLRRAADLL